jgi:UMF1 family MFS transporter
MKEEAAGVTATPSRDPQAEREYHRVINAWAMYDWANSAFATTVMAAVFPIYYRHMVLAAGRSEADATAYWGYSTSVALLLIAVLGPVLGTMSDCTGSKKRFVVAFSAIGVLGTALLACLGKDTYLLGSFFFTLGNIGFAGANIFYEALLPHIARPEDLDKVSTKGYAVGYIGGGVLLAINLLWISKPEWFLIPNAAIAVRIAFLSVAVWWAVFTIPLIRRVPEPPSDGPLEGRLSPWRASFARLAATGRKLPRFRQLLIFLLSFWIFSDGIGTVIKMATAYGDEIGVNQSAMMVALIITQFVGIPCAFAFGWMAGKLGAKLSVLLGLGVYVIITILGYFMKTEAHFYALAILVGLVQGGTQALARSMFASMVPRTQTAEFFGFYSTGEKFAGIIGPALFGAIGQAFQSSRAGILSISILFIVGALLLLCVNEREGARVAAEEDALELATRANSIRAQG